MFRFRPRPFLALIALLFAAVPRPATGATLPPGFVVENVTPGQTLDVPTAMAFLPDGRILVAEKAGRLRVIQNGVLLSKPMWSAEKEILDNGDRGLVGLAVDPNYATNRYIYMGYVVDPDSNGIDDDWVAFSRLVRYQTSLADPNVLDLASRTILFGQSWADGIPSGGDSHTIDCLRFAPDGTLLVSAGDGASYNVVDSGGLHGPIFFPGRLDPAQDIGAFRSQMLGSKSGKIMRLDPATGFGLPSNPFYNGNPAANISRVYAYGLRNPFRFTIRPGTGDVNPANGMPGILYIGEVGWADWEEMNVARTPGRNFGWPCFEGPYPHTGYQAATPANSGCATIGTPANPSPAQPGLVTWHHLDANLSLPPGIRGNSSTGGCFYTGTRYPAGYQGAFFMGDLGLDWIKVVHVSATDSLLGISDFGEGTMGPVDMQRQPITGDILYLAIYTGEIMRLRYTPAPPVNLPPTAVASATPLVGVAPFQVAFSSAGSSDPELDPLGFGWIFGDGVSVAGNAPLHTFATPGVYQVIMVADDGQGNSGRDTLEVAVLASTAFPVTPILDNFNRPDSTLIGSNWSGNTGAFSIEANTLHQVGSGGRLRWSATAFDPAQEAFFTFYEMVPQGGYDLFLKLQPDTLNPSGLRLHYDVDSGMVELTSFTNGAPEVLLGGPLALPSVDGDQLGARVYTNGVVQVFQNGAPAVTWSAAAWPYMAQGGRIGVGMTGDAALHHAGGAQPNHSGGAHLDDFGGGTVILNANTPPLATILAPADSSFFSSADSLHFAAMVSDAEDPDSSLVSTWDLDLRHNNHTHPSIFHHVGLNAAYLPEDHDDGTGVHLIARFKVMDSEGLSASRRLDLFPEVDLRPGLPTILPQNATAADTLTFRFRIHNMGRMPTPTSRWRLTADGATLAEGNVIVPKLDSVLVVVTLPPTLMPGEHVIGLRGDLLGQVFETNEANNFVTAPLHIDEDTSGLPPEPGPRLALSDPFPNPTAGTMQWLLSLPSPTTVRMDVYDIQGRLLWQGTARSYDSGRWRLEWPGTDRSGARVPSGIYMTRISAGAHSWTQRVIRLK